MGKDKPEKKKNDQPRMQQQERGASSGGIWEDERFQHLVSDPRFKSIPKVQRKVKIDKRFQGMFTDDKFKVKYTVDKYGRRVNKSNAEDLRKYYELNSDTDSEEEEERRKEEKAISRDAADESGESTPAEEEPGENDALVSDGEEVPKTLRERLLDPNIDYARGEGRLVTDSSSDDESSEDEDDPEMYIDHVWGELDANAEMTEESTRRLAVCNMDWDRIRALDLMVLFSSFLPPGGSVLSVKIYPSQFGKERMAEEEVHGPIELVGLGKEMKSAKQLVSDTGESSDTDDELIKEQDSDAEQGDEYHMEKLRQYQLNRLRYYYAVVECDSVATADKIYKECDGIEYESSATRVDLRFIPDDTTFDEDVPTDVCNELPDANSYKPRQFTTTALQQAKVDLTWDETAVERRELGEKLSSGQLDSISDKELRKVVAYSSEEDEEEEEEEQDATEGERDAVEHNANSDIGQKEKCESVKTGKNKKKKEDVISKYKALLEEINEKEQKEKNKKYEMEFTWNIEETKTTENDDKDLDADVKPKQQLTAIEKVLQKRSERNKKRKEERKRKKLQAQGLDPDAINDGSDSDSIPDGIDLNDPYFAEEFANGDFIDTKAKQREKAKQKKKALEKQQQEEEAEKQAKELQLLLDEDDLEEQDKQHFSLDKILKTEQETKSKKKRRKQLKKSKSAIAEETKEIEDNFKINVNDERFGALYSSPKFNIDPTDSHFKKTKAMEQIIQEKLKRRYGENGKGVATDGAKDNRLEVEVKRPKKQLENTLLVKSLKRKIQIKQQQK